MSKSTQVKCLCIALLAALMMPGMAFAEKSAAEHQQFLFAYKLLQRKDLDAAGKEFDEYLGKFPKGEKLGDAQYYRALIYRKTGENKKAAEMLAKAAKPKLVPGYAVDLLQGQVLSDLRQYKEALKALERIDTTKLKPKVAVSALYLKGLAYRGANNLKGAAAALDAASKLDTPLKARALLDLAKVWALLKENDRAIQALNRCLAVDNKAVTPEAARFAGDISYNAGAHKQAIGYYSTVVSGHQRSRHFSPSVIGLLWAQFASKQYDDLLTSFNASINALPVQDRLAAHYLAGSAYQAQAKHKEAAAEFDKVAKGDVQLPIMEKVLYKLAVSRFELGEYEKMNTAAQRLKKLFPKTSLRVDLAFLQATAEAKAGQVQRGAARLTEFIDRGDSDPYYRQALLRRAHLYETHGEKKAAADDYETYLKSVKTPTPKSLQASFRLMELLGALDKHGRVATLASGVLEIGDTKLRTPEVEQEAMYRLAVANRFGGKLDEAFTLHEQLSRKHPLNPYRAESLLEQGLIRMAQDKSDRGIPLLLDAIKKEGLSDSSKINAMRIVAQHDAQSDNQKRALELRLAMRKLGGDKVFTDTERLWLGRVMIEQDQEAKAIGYLDAVKDKQLRVSAMLLKGRALRKAGKLKEAGQVLDQAIAEGDRADGVRARFEIALVHRDKGELSKALGQLAELQNPDNGRTIAANAHFEAGMIYRLQYNDAMKRDNKTKAATYADQAGRAFRMLFLMIPDQKGESLAKRGFLAYADLQRDSGDKAGEVKTLTELMEKYPKSAHGMYARAVLAIRAKRPEQADRDLRKTVEMAKQVGDNDLVERAQKLLKRD